MPVLLGKFIWIREFLGAAIWAPLAKMGFAVYLMHILVLFAVMSSLETSVYFSPLYGAIWTLFITFIAYAVGYATSMLVEAPCMSLEKIMFGAPRREPTAAEVP